MLSPHDCVKPVKKLNKIAKYLQLLGPVFVLAGGVMKLWQPGLEN